MPADRTDAVTPSVQPDLGARLVLADRRRFSQHPATANPARFALKAARAKDHNGATCGGAALAGPSA